LKPEKLTIAEHLGILWAVALVFGCYGCIFYYAFKAIVGEK